MLKKDTFILIMVEAKYTTGQKVEMLRIFVGLTQTQLSILIEMDQSYLSKIERGDIKNPSIEQLTKIAEVCGMHSSYFMTDHLPHRYYDFAENLEIALHLKGLPVQVRKYFIEAIMHLYNFTAQEEKRIEDGIPTGHQNLLRPFNKNYFKMIEDHKLGTINHQPAE